MFSIEIGQNHGERPMRAIVRHYPGQENRVLNRRFNWCNTRLNADSACPWNNGSLKIFLLSKYGLAINLCNFNRFNEVGRSQRVQ